MSFEYLVILLTIISLLLQAIGIIVAIHGIAEYNEQRDIHAKRDFNSKSMTDEKFKSTQKLSQDVNEDCNSSLY